MEETAKQSPGEISLTKDMIENTNKIYTDVIDIGKETAMIFHFNNM